VVRSPGFKADQELNPGVGTYQQCDLVECISLQGCYSRIPKPGGPKTTESDCLTDLEVKCLKSNHQQGHALSDSSRGGGGGAFLPLLVSGTC